MSHDGWGEQKDLECVKEKYTIIDNELEMFPIEFNLKEPDDLFERPRFRRERCDSDSDEDHINPDEIVKPRFFTPPLQVQRNAFVRDTIKEFSINSSEGMLESLAVLGCGELSLERFLLHSLSSMGIERVASVDIDENALAKGMKLLKGTMKHVDGVIKGNDDYPGLLQQYLGSILEYDSRMVNMDCVCSTEVIEHISLEEAEKFLRVVLGKIQPRLAIISTPNHEYNEAFDMAKGEFRHDDHKYEFTREEFKHWLEKIVPCYPAYDYRIEYVGNIDKFKHLSGATQFVVLWRKEGHQKHHMLTPANVFLKVGEMVTHGNLYRLSKTLILAAFKQWLEDTVLDQTTLVKDTTVSGLPPFWKVPVFDIIDRIKVGKTIKATFQPDVVMDTIDMSCRGRLFTEDAKMGHMPYIVIPSSVPKSELFRYLP